MIMISKLPQAVIDEGRDHPFVVALVAELRNGREGCLLAAEGAASSLSDAPVRGYITRAGMLREIVSMIENAKGTSE